MFPAMQIAGLALAAMVAITPAVWGEYKTGCSFENWRGDRFQFGSEPWAWVYVPQKGEPEGCSYGFDPDVGEQTVDCETFSGSVISAGDDTVTILGDRWIYVCPVHQLDLGL